jgi:hypothetical protein
MTPALIRQHPKIAPSLVRFVNLGDLWRKPEGKTHEMTAAESHIETVAQEAQNDRLAMIDLQGRVAALEALAWLRHKGSAILSETPVASAVSTRTRESMGRGR